MKPHIQKVRELVKEWAKPIEARIKQMNAPPGTEETVYQPDLSKDSIPGARVTSPFGMREHPKSHDIKMHKGVDIGAGRRPAYAVIDGRVTHAGPAGNAGNMVTISREDEKGYQHKYMYMHLDSISVRQGQEIRKGDQVGVMGATGDVTGVHLHLEHRINDRPVSPSKEEMNAAISGTGTAS